MAERAENMSGERKSASSKSDFIRISGIGPELAEFVTEFIKKPEMFFSMSLERRYEIENQMDAILSSFSLKPPPLVEDRDRLYRSGVKKRSTAIFSPLVAGDWGWRSE